MYNPFDILGIWKLTSEKSEELMAFLPNGVYRIYYEIPFRMIEMGEWSIINGSLIRTVSKIDIAEKILTLRQKKLVLEPPGEHEFSAYEKVEHLKKFRYAK